MTKKSGLLLLNFGIMNLVAHIHDMIHLPENLEKWISQNGYLLKKANILNSTDGKH